MSNRFSGCLTFLRTLFLLGLLASILPSCGFTDEVEIPVDNLNTPSLSEEQHVKDAVETYHVQFNQGNCQGLYDSSGGKFTESLSPSDWLAQCEQARNQQGPIQTSQFLNLVGQDSAYVAQYRTQFSKLSAIEEFTWQVQDDGKAVLVSYRLTPIVNNPKAVLSPRSPADNFDWWWWK